MEKAKKIQSNLPLVAIVGRTNVGKSTLFNKIIEQRKALVSDIAGTTRDLNFGIGDWQGRQFEIVDAGGVFEFKVKSKKLKVNNIEKSIEEQTELKAREILTKANLILFVVDSKDKILKDDRAVANFLKKDFLKDKKTPVILVANKIDKTKLKTPEEFVKLGIGLPIGVSSASGSGIGDLLDKVVKELKFKGRKTNVEKEKERLTRVAIVGKPNAGKSSLLNQILGEERVIVSATPHTTREPQDTLIDFKGTKIELVDTAGIRRKNKIRPESLEKSGIQMSIKKLRESDIALFVVDISKNLSQQDAQLAGLIIESGISVIFVANKYDLINAEPDTTKKLNEYIYKFFPFLTWAPIIYTSSKSGRNCQKVMNLVMDVKAAREQQINKTELTDFVKYLMKKMPPPRQPRKIGSDKKSRAYISRFIQVATHRPIFEVHVTNATKIPESYLNYIENNIRNRFKFIGTPLQFRVKRHKEQEAAFKFNK